MQHYHQARGVTMSVWQKLWKRVRGVKALAHFGGAWIMAGVAEIPVLYFSAVPVYHHEFSMLVPAQETKTPCVGKKTPLVSLPTQGVEFSSDTNTGFSWFDKLTRGAPIVGVPTRGRLISHSGKFLCWSPIRSFWSNKVFNQHPTMGKHRVGSHSVVRVIIDILDFCRLTNKISFIQFKIILLYSIV